jgi:lysophospholipase L1-like esterase
MWTPRISKRQAAWLGFAAVVALLGLVLFTVLVVRIDAPDRPAPRSRDYAWMSLATWWRRHEALVRMDPALKEKAELVFIGDSIVEGWDKALWDRYYAPHHAMNLGLGGDKTQQVIWRLLHEEVDGMRPKLVVLLIGTNNLGPDGAPAAAVAQGVGKILEVLHGKLPEARIILLGILPRDHDPNTLVRRQIADTNALLARLADGDRIVFIDTGPRLLEPDGTISPAIMADHLHPTAQGYRILSEAIAPQLGAMLGKSRPGGR